MAEAAVEELQETQAEIDEKELEAEQKRQAVKKHREQLGVDLANGSEPCKKCGFDPVGMLKTIGYFDQQKNVDVPPVYEVGCIFCPPVYIEHEERGVPAKLDGKDTKAARLSISARGTTPEQAVQNWNKGNYVVDTRFGINVSPDELRRLELLEQ